MAKVWGWMVVVGLCALCAGCAGDASSGAPDGDGGPVDALGSVPGTDAPMDLTADAPVDAPVDADLETSDATPPVDVPAEISPPDDLVSPDVDTADDIVVPVEAGWHARAALPNGPRQELGVAALEGKIYVVGGFTTSLSVVSEVVVYDPATDGWSSAAPMPAARHHTNLAAIGGKLIVAGSNDGFFFTARGETWIYDPQTDAWTEGASMPSGTERGAAAVGVIGEQMFIAGGLRGGDAVGDVSAYDPSADAWEALPALPEALDHLVGGVIDGVFYVVGGRKGGTGSHIPRVDAYDPAQGVWTPRSPMPTSRGGAAAGVVNGLLIVVGGEGNPDAGSGVFDDAEAYDPVTDTWTTLPAMTTPRHGTGAAGLDGVLYVPGGADQELFGAVATHEALVL